MSTQVLCKGCGEPIGAAYITALGAPWHREHFRCVGCGRPINGDKFCERNGAPYHTQCHLRLVAPRCDLCGKPFTNQYLVDHWGTKFCPEHKYRYPSCCFCGRLVPANRQLRLSNGCEGVRCLVCRSSAVESVAKAQPIFDRMIEWANNQGLTYKGLRLHIELGNQSELARGQGGDGNIHTLGATEFKTYALFGLLSLGTQVDAVTVVCGMPAALFEAVVAHELGHVWLAIHGLDGFPSWAVEGFCEVLAHRRLTQIATAESRYYAMIIEKSTDPVYGDGFRRVRSVAGTVGFHRLVETLRTTRRLPMEQLPTGPWRQSGGGKQ